MFKIICIVLLSLVTICYGIYENCDKEIVLDAYQSQTIYSPRFPLPYEPGSSCRYYVKAPSAYNIRLTCSYYLQKTQHECETELLRVSSDDMTLIVAETYCGLNTITRDSLFNELWFGYTSTSSYKRGIFKCEVTAQPQPCDCGWTVNQKIVGGTVAQTNQYPSMVGLYDTDLEEIFCSATIINYRYLLTAAHCVLFSSDPTKIRAYVGDQDITVTTETKYNQIYYISRIIANKLYDSTTDENDIAVLETTTDIIYKRGVGPACLPTKYLYNNFIGSKVNIAGWGTTELAGRPSNVLLTTTLDVVQSALCSAMQICTYTAGKDSCQKDSGGPLYFIQDRMFVIGIISAGFGCANSLPGINTRVTSYLTWIYNNTNVPYCQK